MPTISPQEQAARLKIRAELDKVKGFIGIKECREIAAETGTHTAETIQMVLWGHRFNLDIIEKLILKGKAKAARFASLAPTVNEPTTDRPKPRPRPKSPLKTPENGPVESATPPTVEENPTPTTKRKKKAVPTDEPTTTS